MITHIPIRTLRLLPAGAGYASGNRALWRGEGSDFGAHGMCVTGNLTTTIPTPAA